MFNLTISHNIYLTREQRYALHEGQDLCVLGVSVPVWYVNKISSEPAKEVFCNYYLKNPKRDLPIQIVEDGYEVYIPMRPAKKTKQLTDDEWRALNMQSPAKLEAYYKSQLSEVSSRMLLDLPDGCAYLFYREHNKIKQDGKTINIMHYVIIKDMSELTNSLCGTIDAISEEHIDSESD